MKVLYECNNLKVPLTRLVKKVLYDLEKMIICFLERNIMKNTKLLVWPLISLLLFACNKPQPTLSESSNSLSSEISSTSENSSASIDSSLISSSEIDTPTHEHLFPNYYQSEAFPAEYLQDFLNDFNVGVKIPSNDVKKEHYYAPTIHDENYGTYFEIFHQAKGMLTFDSYISKLKADSTFITIEDEAQYVTFSDLNNEVVIEVLYLGEDTDYLAEGLLIYINIIDDFTSITLTNWPHKQISHYLASFGLDNILPQGLDREYHVSYMRYEDDFDYNYMSISTSDTENIVVGDYTSKLLNAGWTKEGEGNDAVLSKVGTSLTVSFTHYNSDNNPTTIYLSPQTLKLTTPLPFTYESVQTLSFASEDQLVVKDAQESIYKVGPVEMTINKANSTVNVGNIIVNNEKQFFAPILRVYDGQSVVISAGDYNIKAIVLTYDQVGESEEGIYLNALLKGIYHPASGYNFDDSKVLIKAYGPLESVTFSPDGQTRLLSVSVFY